MAELGRRLEGVRLVLEGVQDLLGLAVQEVWHEQLQEAISSNLSRDLSHLELQSSRTRGKRAVSAPSPLTFLGRQGAFQNSKFQTKRDSS